MAHLLHQRNVPNDYPTATEKARAEAPGSLCKFVSKRDIGEALQLQLIQAQDCHDVDLERLFKLFLVGALVGAVHLAAPRGQL